MKNKKYILLADAFGYGPITTLINVSKELKKYNVKQVFIGPNFCLEKIKLENLCDEYIEMNYTEEEIDKNIDYFKDADKIIAVETTDILIYLIKKYKLKNIYLIDNLFWMWDFLEEELKELKKYYISNVISVDENIKRIASDFTNIKKVGSLRNLNKFKRINENNLMISLGGAKSYMFDAKISNNFYLKCIDIIQKNKNINKFNNIYIACGDELVEYIKNNLKLNDNIIIKNYSHEEYLNKLYSCNYAIMSPGLGNFNEIISTNINILFLLPINYSQHLQRLKYKEFKINFHFQENNNEKYIEKYLEESVGVKQSTHNLMKYDFKNFNSELDKFLESKVDEEERHCFYKNINKDGLKEICEDLIG